MFDSPLKFIRLFLHFLHTYLLFYSNYIDLTNAYTAIVYPGKKQIKRDF